MADAETQSLTAQQQQQQHVIVSTIQPAPNNNVQYVYAQPQAQNVQYVYTQPQQQQQQQHVVVIPTDNQNEGGYHAPTHKLNTDDDDTNEQQQGEASSTIVIVKWENLKLPIPVNHATFMRKVWLTLVLQLIFTAGMIALCMYVDPIRLWVIHNYWMYWIGIIGSLFILCALFGARNKYPTNIILLCLFTLFMAYSVAMICASYASYGMADIVMEAFGITILVFLGLAIFSMNTKCNLMPLGMVAFMVLNVMMWWGLWALIFGWYNSSAWALMFIIIFCMLIMFDVWRMCNMPQFEESAWIMGACNLYLDVINLFLWILHCMAWW